MLDWWQIVPNLVPTLCLNYLPLTPHCLKLNILSWTVTPTVTSQLIYAAVQTTLHGREPGYMLILHAPPFSRTSQANSFIVPRSLSTTWRTQTVLPMASQVVVPPMQDFNSPFSIVCGNSSISFTTSSATRSTVCSALPSLLCLVRWGRSYGSRVINSQRQYSNVVLWSSVSFLVILALSTRHACVSHFPASWSQCPSKCFSSSIVPGLFWVHEV